MSTQTQDKNLLEEAVSTDIAAKGQKSQVERLQKRIDELEKKLDEDSEGNLEKPDWIRDCTACEHIITEALEYHPALRELRDKFQKYHFKFLECRNENLLLRRELAIAKKVLCQELGIDAVNFKYLLKHATEEGWKGRREKLVALQQKNHQLESKLKAIEGKEEPPKASPSEQDARENISEDRKAFWRMELEKRKGYQMGDKERCDLAQENLDLRRNLEQSKQRMRELVAEIRMLKGEVFAFSEKGREDNVIIQSLQNTESQLKQVLEDRSDLRRELTAERCRNRTLKEKIEMLKEQMESFKDKIEDDRKFIDALTCQNKRFQCMLENEQTLGHQAAERFKEEMKKMMANHSANSSLLEKMQTALLERDDLVKNLQEKLSEIARYLEKRAEHEAAELEPKTSKSDENKEPEKDEEEHASKEGEDEEAEEPLLDPQQLQMDVAKFKALYEATKEENSTMEDLISALNRKVDELNTHVLITEKRYLQNDLERKELQEKVQRLEKAVKGKKKKKKPWETAKKPSPPQVPPRSKADEIAMKLDVMMEENNFLRSFLANTIGAKEEDFLLYRLIAQNAEKHFETSIEAIKEELAIKKAAPEENEEAGEDEEEDEN